IELARFEHRLAGNTADAQAGSAQRRLFLHACDVQSQLRGPDGSDIAPRTTANHDQIMLRHARRLEVCRSAVSTRTMITVRAACEKNQAAQSANQAPQAQLQMSAFMQTLA